MRADELVALVLEAGQYGVQVMALLDQANTTRYGHPELTKVNIGAGKNPGILISGHDLHDLEELLRQTEGTGVDVYTHSEMLPGHYYPAFKQYKHFVGNYGNAWWKQREEFTAFNGPIVFTTNCIVPPLENATYKERMFTANSTGYPGCRHIAADADGHKDFSEVIALAKQCQPPVELEQGEIVGGFAHNQVMQLADKVVEAAKRVPSGKFVVGCDGRMKSQIHYAGILFARLRNAPPRSSTPVAAPPFKLPAGRHPGPRALPTMQTASYSSGRHCLETGRKFSKGMISTKRSIETLPVRAESRHCPVGFCWLSGRKHIHRGPPCWLPFTYRGQRWLSSSASHYFPDEDLNGSESCK